MSSLTKPYLEIVEQPKSVSCLLHVVYIVYVHASIVVIPVYCMWLALHQHAFVFSAENVGHNEERILIMSYM